MRSEKPLGVQNPLEVYFATDREGIKVYSEPEGQVELLVAIVRNILKAWLGTTGTKNSTSVLKRRSTGLTGLERWYKLSSMAQAVRRHFNCIFLPY